MMEARQKERHERTRSGRRHANHRRASTRADYQSPIKARELKRRFQKKHGCDLSADLEICSFEDGP
jgi:hypothetical protein